MRHNNSGRKLNRTTAHRKMLLRNLVTALFDHERIQTTIVKAKETRSLAERLITFAKRGDLHARRQAARKLNDPQILRKLFDEIGPRYSDRPGGYTRILRLNGLRHGDAAEMAILELVDSAVRPKSLDSKKRQHARRILKAEQKAEAEAALQEVAAERDQADAAATEEEDSSAVRTDAPMEEESAQPGDQDENESASPSKGEDGDDQPPRG